MTCSNAIRITIYNCRNWPESAAARRPADSEPTAAGPPSFPPPHGTPAQSAKPKADKQSR